MARPGKIWWRTDRRAWFATIGGKKISLGPDDAAATREYHRLLSLPPQARAAPVEATLTVADVYEKYLVWCRAHRSERTYEWTALHTSLFCSTVKAMLTLPADKLRPFHLTEYIDSHLTWGPNQKRGVTVALTRPFSWAAKSGHIDNSPVRGTERPPAVARKAKLTPERFADLVGSMQAGDPFRDLLEFSWEVGVRPQEVRAIEVRHVRSDLHRIEFPPEESKGKSRWRVIYLTPAAEVILARRSAARADGHVFLNTKGRAWTADAISCRFGKIKGKTGERFPLGDLRKLFATRKLKEGVDPITVAALLGHKDAAMLCKHYEQLSTDNAHLLAAVTGFAGGRTSSPVPASPPAVPSAPPSPLPPGTAPGKRRGRRP